MKITFKKTEKDTTFDFEIDKVTILVGLIVLTDKLEVLKMLKDLL